MAKYRRAKREDFVKSQTQQMSIKIGRVTDSYESLRAMCNDKSVELLKTIDLGDSKELKVVFWTMDYPELIGIASFTKNEAGMLTFTFDESQRTL